MTFFPTKERTFKLHGKQIESLERLQRKTERSENLTSQHTDKSFIGIITGNQFQLISSAVSKRPLCVMKGDIQDGKGYVKVEIYKPLKLLISIFLFVFSIAILLPLLLGAKNFPPAFYVMGFGLILFFRFVLIKFMFKTISDTSLNSLSDVLDFEWTINYQ
ncbi:hypothetical protein SAMN06265376_11272 [Dokdonia pacifica]|uniref:Uncharacterized protein n=2 Tax=Dokdonia pacifica TaxID=1627892 RepID=A0A239DVD2_9FLAO|nr:hypothetical protein SAMN06265376_11272 [Dokdonia pacifica]